MAQTVTGDMNEYEWRLARFYAWIDLWAVTAVLAIVGGSVWALVSMHIPEAQLAILASLDSALLSAVVAGYAGFRWGASLQNSMKQKTALSDPTVTTITTPAKTTTAATVVTESTDPKPKDQTDDLSNGSADQPPKDGAV